MCSAGQLEVNNEGTYKYHTTFDCANGAHDLHLECLYVGYL